MTDQVVTIEMPERESYGEVMKGYFSLMRGFGTELGAMCDRTLGPVLGKGWWGEYVQKRKAQGFLKGKVNLRDPSIVLNEYLWADPSPLRDVFSADTESKILAKKIVSTRNVWVHFGEEPSTVDLQNAAALILGFAELHGMKVAGPASRLIARVKKIRTGQYQAPVAAQSAPAVVLTPPSVLPVASQPGPPDDGGDAISVPSVDEPSRPPIGGTWIGAIPAGRYRVTKTRDLLDVETGGSARDRVDADFSEKLRSWLAAKPIGDLWIDMDGAIGGYVQGTPRLLGYLGPDPEDEIARGFLVPHYYDFEGGHVTDLDSGQRLVEAATPGSRTLVDQIERSVAEAVGPGGSLRITTYGDLVYLDEHDIRRLATVAPDAWFPGHLG